MLLTSELNKPQMQETPRSESLALPRGANTFSLAILQCSGTWLGTLRPITPGVQLCTGLCEGFPKNAEPECHFPSLGRGGATPGVGVLRAVLPGEPGSQPLPLPSRQAWPPPRTRSSSSLPWNPRRPPSTAGSCGCTSSLSSAARPRSMGTAPVTQ